MSNKGRISSCGKIYTCDGQNTRIEKVSTTDGDVTLTVIESCGCVKRPHGCQRIPKTVTRHKGTPLETSIDVGMCRGHCSSCK